MQGQKWRRINHVGILCEPISWALQPCQNVCVFLDVLYNEVNTPGCIRNFTTTDIFRMSATVFAATLICIKGWSLQCSQTFNKTNESACHFPCLDKFFSQNSFNTTPTIIELVNFWTHGINQFLNSFMIIMLVYISFMHNATK